MVRDTGQVITGTGYSATTLGLPTEERETREQARARIEAKRARQRTTSPFGHLPPALDDSATAAQKRARTHNLQHPLSEDGVVQGAAARAAAEEAARERAAAIAADADARRKASRPAPSNAARDPELVRAIVDAYTGPEQATVPALAARHERSRDLVRKILVAAGVELRDDRARNGANLDAVRPTTARRAPEPTPEPVAPQEPTSEPEPAPALEDHPDVRAFFAALQDALDSGAEAVLADVRNATSRLRARAVANRRVAAANRGETL